MAELAGDCYTTQIPAVVCCGPAGERKSRSAACFTARLPGCAVRFGGVFGSKNSRQSARSATDRSIATQAFMDARLWFASFSGTWITRASRRNSRRVQPDQTAPERPETFPTVDESRSPRAAACASCPRGCRMRLATADSNEAVCAGNHVARIGAAGLAGRRRQAGPQCDAHSTQSEKLTRQGQLSDA